MKKLIYITAICLLTSFGAKAQGMMSVSYDIGVPMGGTSDFIGQPSFRGFGLEGRVFIYDYLSYGGSFNWSVFYEEVEAQEWPLEDGGTAYGKQYRYINSFPLMATMHYYFGEWNSTRLYAGTGIGTQKINQRRDVGLYTVEDRDWRFAIAPEIGVLIPVNYNSSLNISARYQYAAKTGKTDAVSYLSFKIGLAFM